MAGSIQLSTILFKTETTSGTSSTPTNVADAVAIRVTNLSCKINELMAERDVIVGAFAAADQLPYARRGEVSFSVEMQASGTLGTAPQWGDLLLCCGFSETVTATTRVDYLPASTALKTATIQVNYNNRIETFVYAAGMVKVNAEIGQVPSLDFTFTGLVLSVAQAAPISATLTAWIRAEAISTTATTQMSIGAVTYSAGAITGGTLYSWQKCAIDLANDVQDVALVGQETVAIYGRAPKAEIVADLGGTAHAAFKADMHAGTTRAFGFVHGSTAGKKVGIYAPVGVLTSVEDVVDGQRIMDSLGMTLRPVAANDELRIWCA